VAELLRTLLEHGGRATALPGPYGDAYEPRLPWQPKRIVTLDTEWLLRWREDVAEVVGSVMPTFEERMGYPPGNNPVGPPMSSARFAEIAESVPLLPADLELFCQIVGEVSLPDIGNGWFLLKPFCRKRIGPPYNIDIVEFASDGGGTIYALPAGGPGPVLRLREVGEIAPGVFDGHGVYVLAPALRAFLANLRDLFRLFAATGSVTDL
jgi:hypothetical protein